MAMLNKFSADYVRDASQQSRNNNDQRLSESVGGATKPVGK
jgi:hypothetical protein